jgi:mannose-6-phosphate isomerase-like protein (cupin superfamily)
MKKFNSQNISETYAHGEVPRKALVKAGDLKSDIQTANDAWLEPGKGFTPHTHGDCEEFYYFLEGEGELTIDGKIHTVKPGDFIVIELNEEHSVLNTGKKKLRYFTVRYKTT